MKLFEPLIEVRDLGIGKAAGLLSLCPDQAAHLRIERGVGARHHGDGHNSRLRSAVGVGERVAKTYRPRERACGCKMQHMGFTFTLNAGLSGFDCRVRHDGRTGERSFRRALRQIDRSAGAGHHFQCEGRRKRDIQWLYRVCDRCCGAVGVAISITLISRRDGMASHGKVGNLQGGFITGKCRRMADISNGEHDSAIRIAGTR